MRTWIVFATTLAACSESGESNPSPGEARDASALSVQIGTGEVTFEPIDDGGASPLIAGAQGGFHVWVSVRAFGFTGPHLDTTVTTELLAEDGGVDGAAEARTSMLRLRFDPAEDEGLEFIGWPGVLDTTVCPVDRLARIQVKLSEDGLSKETEITMRVDGNGAFRLPISCPAPADGGP